MPFQEGKFEATISENDNVLNELAGDVASKIGVETLEALVTSTPKLLEPTHTYDPQTGTIEQDENGELREYLYAVNEMLDSAEDTSLTREEALVLIQKLSTVKEYSADSATDNLIAFNRYLDSAKQSEGYFESLDVDTLVRSLDIASSQMVVPNLLINLSVTSRINVSPNAYLESACAVMEKQGAFSVYSFNHINRLCRCFIDEDIPQEKLTSLIVSFSQLDPRRDGETFKLGETLFTYVPDIAQTVEYIADRYAEGNDVGSIILNMPNDLLGFERSPEVIDTTTISSIFHLREGALEPLLRPYRSERALCEGIRDLNEVCNSSEEVVTSEGFWIFTQDNTWVSLGGLTEEVNGSLRHEFAVPLDLSRLGDSPYLFHVHPASFDVQIFSKLPHPRKVHESDREGLYALRQLYVALPSEQDLTSLRDLILDNGLNPRGKYVIANSSGFTLLEYDLTTEEENRLQDISKLIEEYKTNSLVDFKSEYKLEDHIYKINKQMLEGFRLSVYPNQEALLLELTKVAKDGHDQCIFDAVREASIYKRANKVLRKSDRDRIETLRQKAATVNSRKHVEGELLAVDSVIQSINILVSELSAIEIPIKKVVLSNSIGDEFKAREDDAAFLDYTDVEFIPEGASEVHFPAIFYVEKDTDPPESHVWYCHDTTDYYKKFFRNVVIFDGSIKGYIELA